MRFRHLISLVLRRSTSTSEMDYRDYEEAAKKGHASMLKLQRPSHKGVAHKLGTIGERPVPPGQEHIVGIMRKPSQMSANVEVGCDMIIVQGASGWYEFQFINEVWAEQVYFDITYCSGDPRPITLIINGGQTVDKSCCSTSTGGYGSQSFIHVRCGPYPIQTEVNTVKVTTDSNFFPHIAEIRAIDVRTESNSPTVQSSGTWIVVPSKPMRADLECQLKDLCFVENTQEANPDFIPDPSFYNGINLDGLWVLTSKEVDVRVLHQAAELLSRYIPIELRRLCLQWRAPKGMPRGPFRLVILDNVTNQRAGDCPDFPDSWGGRNGTSNPGIFSSAEDFRRNPGMGPCGALTVHEVTHGLDMVIRQQLDPYFFQECEEAYEAAIAQKTYRKAYAAANRHEYLAELCTLFVGTAPGNFARGCSQCNEAKSGYCEHAPHSKFPAGAEGVEFRRKSDLVMNDRLGYELLKSFLIEIKDQDDDSFWWQ